MRKKMILGLLVLFLAILAGTPALHAEEEDLITQEGASGAGARPSVPVEMIDEAAMENNSDPSEFIGDSDSMPGERAPENLPMDDAPGNAGIAIE